MEIAIIDEHRGSEALNLLDAKALAETVLTAEGCPEDTEVSISFVSDETIQRMNATWRSIDRPTDVLSFECDGVDDSFAPGGDEPFQLGDILIAVDVAERQAKDYSMDLGDELALLLTHGLLHLCGYDHLEDEEAQAMEAREGELLTDFLGHPFLRCGRDG